MSIRPSSQSQTVPEDFSGHTPLSVAEIRAFVASHRWVFAKTMPGCPHEYTLRREAPNDALFARMIRHIRQFGYDEAWGRNVHRYLDFDGWKYWTMGYLTSTTILINRARLDRPEHPHTVNPVHFMARHWPVPWDQQ